MNEIVQVIKDAHLLATEKAALDLRMLNNRNKLKDLAEKDPEVFNKRWVIDCKLVSLFRDTSGMIRIQVDKIEGVYTSQTQPEDPRLEEVKNDRRV